MLGDVWKAKILEKVQQDNRIELQAMKSEMEASVDKANRLLDDHDVHAPGEYVRSRGE